LSQLKLNIAILYIPGENSETGFLNFHRDTRGAGNERVFRPKSVKNDLTPKDYQKINYSINVGWVSEARNPPFLQDLWCVTDYRQARTLQIGDFLFGSPLTPNS
jgi:hypothetical protein